jgi:hypothetical protein
MQRNLGSERSVNIDTVTARMGEDWNRSLVMLAESAEWKMCRRCGRFTLLPPLQVRILRILLSRIIYKNIDFVVLHMALV